VVSETPSRPREEVPDTPEEELVRALEAVPRKRAPAGLWGRIALSISPEARAARLLARRRRVVKALAVAASVLLAVGLWQFVAWRGVTGVSVSVPVTPVVHIPEPEPEAVEVEPGLEQELETLGQVHLVYEAGNVVPEELVLAEAGESYGQW